MRAWSGRRSLGVLLPLLATAGVLYWFAATEGPTAPPTLVDEDEDGSDKLTIPWVDPVEVAPGEAVLAHVAGLTEGGAIRARVSAGERKFGVRVLRRDGPRVAVQMPRDIPRGIVKLRVFQDDRKSKPRLLQVRPIPLRDMARDSLGGLALFVVGLTLIGRALRNYAGHSIRARLSALTRSPPRGVAVGSLLGGLTQSTTSSAGILVGMLEARLLPERAAGALLVGAQLGAASAGALLPLFATREALWVVVLGALWTAGASDRRARAFGHIVLGCGLLFLGLALLQGAARGLLSDPLLLPHVHALAAFEGWLIPASAGLGALLAALLQGPGPAFAVVLSLTQSTGVLSVQDGLTILAGTAVGATAGSFVVGWPAGQAGRRLALTHLLLGSVASLVAVLGVPMWAMAADALVAGDPSSLRYGSRVLRPAVASHLVAGFAISQVAAAVACCAVLPAITRVATRWAPAAGAQDGARDSDLLSVLSACRTAILALGEVVETREREPAVAAERAIGEARLAVTSLLRTIERHPSRQPNTLATATACLHLATATDGALSVAERALERDFVTDPEGARHLTRVHVLLAEGIEALLAHAEGRTALELEQVQAREIRLNVLEAEARALTATGEALAERLWQSELTSACEGIGNHLYRLANALVNEVVLATSDDR